MAVGETVEVERSGEVGTTREKRAEEEREPVVERSVGGVTVSGVDELIGSKVGVATSEEGKSRF